MRPPADANRVIAAGRETTVGELRREGTQRHRDWAGRRVAHGTDDPLAQLRAVLAAIELGVELTLLPGERFTPAWRERLAPLVDLVGDEPGAAPPGEARPGLVLWSSGSTGPPHPVHHGFEVLDTYERLAIEPERWLLTYLAGTYAWVQVVMLGLLVEGQALVVPASAEARDLLGALLAGSATAVPSTPTFWRYALASVGADELSALPVRRITLGGERADQAILDALRERFPRATIVHTFATTETGIALSVSDGRAGFPASYLEHPVLGGRVELRVHDGALQVRSPLTEAGPGEWVDTGDLAEVRGDRVHLVGRRGLDTITVAGRKVVRQEVEDFVRGLDGVAWARVHAVRAPLVGEVVGLEVVLDTGEGDAEAQARIAQAVAAAFSDYHAPKRVRVLGSVPIDSARKTAV